jgi:hypothetical protein
MFVCREWRAQASPVPDNYNVMMSSKNCCSASLLAAVYNKLAGGGAGCCASPPEHPAHLTPAFLHVCLLSFFNLPSLPVRFLGQAGAGLKTPYPSLPGSSLPLEPCPQCLNSLCHVSWPLRFIVAWKVRASSLSFFIFIFYFSGDQTYTPTCLVLS